MAYTELEEATNIAEVEKFVPELLARYGLATDQAEKEACASPIKSRTAQPKG